MAHPQPSRPKCINGSAVLPLMLLQVQPKDGTSKKPRPFDELRVWQGSAGIVTGPATKCGRGLRSESGAAASLPNRSNRRRAELVRRVDVSGIVSVNAHWSPRHSRASRHCGTTRPAVPSISRMYRLQCADALMLPYRTGACDAAISIAVLRHLATVRAMCARLRVCVCARVCARTHVCACVHVCACARSCVLVCVWSLQFAP